MVTKPTKQPITLLVCALGGEGGGVLAEWLVTTATACGFASQSTSIPGVAQRTGSTTYYFEVYPEPITSLAGKRPVFSLYPVPGALDVLVSSELLETSRQVVNGMTSPERTHVLTSISRTLTTAEKMQLGDGRADSDNLLEVVSKFSQSTHAFDMTAVAREAGTVVSAVLMGAIAGSGVLPFSREAFETTIRRSGRGVEASLTGFARAFDAVKDAAVTTASARKSPQRPVSSMGTNIASRFPVAVQDIAQLGYERLIDYQGHRYAGLYLDRLASIMDAEKSADPAGRHGFAATRETARYLALWMAFDDIVRVADLKSRASRIARIRDETGARPDELLRVFDFFKPGVPELAGLLPAKLAHPLLNHDRRRRAAGKPPLAFPLRVAAHSVLGFLTLRMLASLKWLRQRSLRYAQEQGMIDRWLDGIRYGFKHEWQLGLEVAQCGRLVKGYGDTNERGKENMLYVLEHLLRHDYDGAAQRAEAIRKVRTAAMADDSGKSLDQALIKLGAPARPLKAQPVVWMKKPRQSVR